MPRTSSERTIADLAAGSPRMRDMDVSPAVRDCLAFRGLNNDENKVAWQFVDSEHVPPGPWRRVVTMRQVFWR